MVAAAAILSLIKDLEHREIYDECVEMLLQQYAVHDDAVHDDAVHDDAVMTTTTLDKVVLNFPEVEALAFQLSRQLQLLEARGYTLLCWQPSAILVVTFQYRTTLYAKTTLYARTTLYVLADLSQYVPLYKKDRSYLILVYPTVFPLPTAVCAPEVVKMDMLPFITHKSASYYSLALLCLHAGNLSLANLTGTKLFYFIERCMQPNPKERSLCYL